MGQDRKNRGVIIFGAGGHAKSVISIIEAEAKWKIHGLYDDDSAALKGRKVLGYTLIDDPFAAQHLGMTRGFVAIGDNQIRAKIANTITYKGIRLIRTIHPRALIMSDSIIGSGTMVHAQAILGAGSRIGTNVIISAMVCVGHDSYIGNNAHLTPGVLVGGGVTVGDYSFLGLGAVVLPKVKVGQNVQVGANSVVHKDLEDNLVVAGNPARVIKRNKPVTTMSG